LPLLCQGHLPFLPPPPHSWHGRFFLSAPKACGFLQLPHHRSSLPGCRKILQSVLPPLLWEYPLFLLYILQYSQCVSYLPSQSLKFLISHHTAPGAAPPSPERIVPLLPWFLTLPHSADTD